MMSSSWLLWLCRMLLIVWCVFLMSVCVVVGIGSLLSSSVGEISGCMVLMWMLLMWVVFCVVLVLFIL